MDCWENPDFVHLDHCSGQNRGILTSTVCLVVKMANLGWFYLVDNYLTMKIGQIICIHISHIVQ